MFFCSSVVSLPLRRPEQELILQPQALFGVGHVRELGADGAAVGVFELREISRSFSVWRELVGTRAGEEFRVEIGFGQPEVAELEHARALALLQAQRIEIGDRGGRGWRRSAPGAKPRPAWRRHRCSGCRRRPRPCAARWRAARCRPARSSESVRRRRRPAASDRPADAGSSRAMRARHSADR